MSNLENCVINTLICSYCGYIHYLSYALDPKTQLKKFYKNAFDLKYFQFSSETVFEVALLKDLHASIIIQSSAFRSFAASYNFNKGLCTKDRNYLNYKRLIEAYHCWQLVKYINEFKNETLTRKFAFSISIYLCFKLNRILKIKSKLLKTTPHTQLIKYL
jgi:hypothetical protein